MADNTDDMTAEEFEEKVAEVETDDSMFENEAEAAESLMDFSDLLNLRDDIADVNDQLNQTSGYYAETTIILEQQADTADRIGETEKAAALRETAGKTEELAERIDGGETLDDVRTEIEAAQQE